MANKHNLQVGQVLYYEEYDNDRIIIKEAVITSIEKNYFKLKGFSNKKFDCEELNHFNGYHRYNQMYLTKDEILNKWECSLLIKFITKTDFNKLPLQKLQQIKSIIDGTN